MLRTTYDWILRVSAHRHAVPMLGIISFLESSIFPIPPDTLLIPMCVSNRERAYTYATICTICSVAGAYLGYFIGYTLYESVGLSIIHFYGLEQDFERLTKQYNDWGYILIIGAGLTPFPYKIITISSGVFGFALIPFTLASLFARGLRFYGSAQLIKQFGAPMQKWLEQNLGLATILFFFLLVGGAFILKYL